MTVADAVRSLSDLVGRLESHLRRGQETTTIRRIGDPILLIKFEDPAFPEESITNLLQQADWKTGHDEPWNLEPHGRCPTVHRNRSNRTWLRMSPRTDWRHPLQGRQEPEGPRHPLLPDPPGTRNQHHRAARCPGTIGHPDRETPRLDVQSPLRTQRG